MCLDVNIDNAATILHSGSAALKREDFHNCTSQEVQT